MKSYTHAFLAAALLAGTATVATAPVNAADKKKDQEAPGLKLSNEVRGPAAAAQTALAAKDFATAGTEIGKAEAAAKTDDEKYIANALKLNLAALQLQAGSGTDAALVAPLDALIANPKTPAADLPRYNYQRGVIAINAKDTAAASTFFERARQLGYNDPNLPLQIVKLKMDAGDVAGGSAELEKMVDAQVAAGTKPDETIYRYAITRTNAKKMGPQTLGWLKRYVTAYPTAKNWRDAVVTYGMQQQGVAVLDKAQKVDLYRLLRAGKALADQYDYEIYGQWAVDLGVPWEAKTVLTEGKATGKVPASSANATSVLAAATKSIANEGSLSALDAKAKASANGKLAAGTADAYLGSDDYAKAAELYRVALQKGQVDADAVNTRLGIALARSGDKAGARTAFEQVKGSPRSDIAGWWILFLDHPPVG